MSMQNIPGPGQVRPGEIYELSMLAMASFQLATIFGIATFMIHRRFRRQHRG